MVLFRPLTPDVLASIGFTTRTRTAASGEMGVRVGIGVRHEPLMRLYERCSSLDTLATLPTIATGLAELLGDAAQEWVFPRSEDPGPVVAEIVEAVKRVGLPWCADHADPSAMRSAVLNRRASGVTHSNEQVLPLLDVFCGEPELATERLLASLRARGERTDDEAIEFAAFARNLLRHIGPARLC